MQETGETWRHVEAVGAPAPRTLLDMNLGKYNSSFKTGISISIPVECDGSAVHKASRSIDPSFTQRAHEITYR